MLVLMEGFKVVMKRLKLEKYPDVARLPPSPNLFSQKREKGNRIQNPFPALGEGFRMGLQNWDAP